MLSKGSSISQ
ncbi:hypothetical protein CGLO_18275 [Colletotrichum gloeosporioides Cg-14]|uniref:Uncharacterized protein n=1 Tax=Colletotrichum gloeosporioides (strain Cg-14) TaxID=1237896 RepID=T0JRW9_COLGC|nr:hypothetical protein CGLO_18275 [Colletotrichum gloeosporioides Cg-14]